MHIWGSENGIADYCICKCRLFKIRKASGSFWRHERLKTFLPTSKSWDPSSERSEHLNVSSVRIQPLAFFRSDISATLLLLWLFLKHISKSKWSYCLQEGDGWCASSHSSQCLCNLAWEMDLPSVELRGVRILFFNDLQQQTMKPKPQGLCWRSVWFPAAEWTSV